MTRFSQKVAVEELRRETVVGSVNFLAIFSTLEYQEAQKTTSGPAMDIEA